MSIEEVICSSDYFKDLPENIINFLVRIAITKDFKADEIIFFENDFANGFYLIASGQVKIYKSSPTGKEHLLRIFEKNEAFGEVPVFLNSNYPACAVCLEDSKLIFFPGKEFRKVLIEQPDMALAWIAVLSERLMNLSSQIEFLAIKDIASRLASYMLDNLSEGKNCFKLQSSKKNLAEILGTVPETLSRTISKFKKTGLIIEEKPYIKILSLEKLRNISNGKVKIDEL